ncbi:MAG: DJ-1/PfpI family protein [Richelia sp. SM1_7_0]|nr:DJ-1/PfpI family protein [Richelia sp. SM1_7_0]
MQVAILLYEGVTALDAIGPYEVLSHLPNVEIIFVATEAGNKKTDTKFLKLVAEKTLEDITSPDIVVIPGGTVGTNETAKDIRVLNWIKAVHQTTLWTTSVCTGALILGAADILQGLQATTHWYARNALTQFGAEYTGARFVEQQKIITAAGVSAGIDMALYLVSKIAGEDYAKSVQLVLEYDPQPLFDCGSLEKADAVVSEKISHRFTEYLKQEMPTGFDSSIFANYKL